MIEWRAPEKNLWEYFVAEERDISREQHLGWIATVLMMCLVAAIGMTGIRQNSIDDRATAILGYDVNNPPAFEGAEDERAAFEEAQRAEIEAAQAQAGEETRESYWMQLTVIAVCGAVALAFVLFSNVPVVRAYQSGNYVVTDVLCTEKVMQEEYSPLLRLSFSRFRRAFYLTVRLSDESTQGVEISRKSAEKIHAGDMLLASHFKGAGNEKRIVHVIAPPQAAPAQEP